MISSKIHGNLLHIRCIFEGSEAEYKFAVSDIKSDAFDMDAAKLLLKNDLKANGIRRGKIWTDAINGFVSAINIVKINNI